MIITYMGSYKTNSDIIVTVVLVNLCTLIRYLHITMVHFVCTSTLFSWINYYEQYFKNFAWADQRERCTLFFIKSNYEGVSID